MKRISADELKQRMDRDPPDNDHPTRGYAVLNVLANLQFSKGHVPHSINIPKEVIEQAERRFSKEKELIVYCSSEMCDASTKAAQELEALGFRYVTDFKGGMREWRHLGLPVEREPPGEMGAAPR